MSTGLYSGVSGLALGTGLYKGTQGLWGGASGLINEFGATLNLDFLAGAPLDSRITFSRTTNATLVDATGRVTYAPNNLVLRSEEFDNAAWTKSASTITANATAAPNGTTTADKLVETTAVTTGHFVLPATAPATVAGQFLVYSVYAKAAERTFIQLITTGIGPAGANLIAGFDLTTGTAGTPSATATSTITPAGDGWYRCSIAVPVVTTATSSLQIRLSLNSTSTPSSYTGDGTSGLFIWGAQFEQVTYQTLPSTYVQTVASAYYGPRFDYNPATLAPRGLLIEEQRVNLALYSEQFDNAAWTKESCAIIANSVVAPDGTTTADTLVRSGTSNSRVLQAVTTTATSSLSVYAKAGTQNFVVFQINVASNTVASFITFDLTNGSVGVSQSVLGSLLLIGSAVNVGNGWYRCSVSYATTTSSNIRIGAANAANTRNGDDGGTIFIWGAQLEAGSFATSYIPTVASTVTRAADVAVMTGTNFSSWYNQSEGTFVSSFEASPNTFTTYVAASNGVVAQNSMHMDNDGAGNMRAAYYSGSSAVALLSLGAVGTIGAVNNIATAYRVNDFAASRNGGAVVTDTAGAVPVGVNRLNIGADPSGAAVNVSNRHIRTITFYATRLSNAQLQALAS